VAVTVTENVTTVTATNDVTVEVTENVTSVAVSENTATITVTPTQTNVEVTGNTTSINVTGSGTDVNVTSDSIGTSGHQTLRSGKLDIVLEKPTGYESDGTTLKGIDDACLRVGVPSRGQNNCGDLIQFTDSFDTTVFGQGSGIGMATNVNFQSLYIYSGDCGLHFTRQSSKIIIPCGSRGENQTGITLGTFSTPFQRLYSQQGVTTTSDMRQKVDIQTLSEAERQVATTCKGLLRKYKWKSDVEENGGDAKWHFGIMAQELEQAFSDNGLDASDYDVLTKEEEEVDGVTETFYGVCYEQLLAFIVSVI
jgi:hypothetical protein